MDRSGGAGKICVSDGSFIDFEVDGNLPGATIGVMGAQQRLQVKVALQAPEGGGMLELVGDGEVIASSAQAESSLSPITAEIPAESLRWLAARYRLPGRSPLLLTRPRCICETRPSAPP